MDYDAMVMLGVLMGVVIAVVLGGVLFRMIAQMVMQRMGTVSSRSSRPKKDLRAIEYRKYEPDAGKRDRSDQS